MNMPLTLALMRILVLLLLAGAPLSATAQSQPTEINIMAGPAQSTSLAIGNDISALGKSCGIEINIHQSSGALDNLLAVKARRHTQMGIIQSDVLEYLRTYEPDVPDIAQAMRGIKMAFPLYQQEVQILVRDDIDTLLDLEGKSVAVGDAESGTFLTATVILDLAGLSEVNRIAENPVTALPALMAGEIDALFFVDGVPSPVFAQEGLDFSGLKLLPIDDPVLSAVYEPATIAAGSYDFVTEDVPAIAVRAIMLAFDYAPRRNNYNRLNCTAVTQITTLLTQKFDDLVRDGHPKWAEVDFLGDYSDWAVAACSRQGLTSATPLTCPEE